MCSNKHFSKIGIAAGVFALIFTVVYLWLAPNYVTSVASDMPYIDKLFDDSIVHTIDIVANEGDWQEMLDNATSEEYISCTVVIDGESFGTVAIRPKGNSSLSQVASSDSDRYSFKIEFDHYNENTTYYGLDKLCLNNTIQDNTYIKDYLVYKLMAEMGVDAPLASFAYITVNGADWGLYTAVEAVEDAFAQRIYGTDHGIIYKPDSMNMNQGGAGGFGEAPGGNFGNRGDVKFGDFEDFEGFEMPDDIIQENFGGRGGMGGMGGSSDVLLQYTDDDPESYPNIFENAVFGISDSDKQRLIDALKKLSDGDIEGSIEIDEVLAYFVVHNFVLNSDSYTGSIIHNYYLYEDVGLFSMIPWDYNLAFGGMSGGDATTLVNSPIDSPVTSGSMDERPMVSWIFSDEAYTEAYHELMDKFISNYFESGYLESLIDNVEALISPYVQKDPTAFCTYNEFKTGIATLKEFCLLRAESIRGQLDGKIATTSEGQSENKANFIDASHLSINDMGSQGGGMGGFGERGNNAALPTENISTMMPNGVTPPDEAGGTMPEQMPPTDESDNGETDNPPSRPEGGMGNQFENPSNTSQNEILKTQLIILAACFVVLVSGILIARRRK